MAAMTMPSRAKPWLEYLNRVLGSISGDPLTHQRCLHLLRGVGGTIVAEHDVQESYSGDGLIVARFCSEPSGWQPVELSHNRVSTSLFRDPLYDLAVANGAEVNRALGR